MTKIVFIACCFATLLEEQLRLKINTVL